MSASTGFSRPSPADGRLTASHRMVVGLSTNMWDTVQGVALRQRRPRKMPPRIVFVLMSAVHSSAAVSELARALAPHRVLIHHDFVQTPEFAIDARNAVFVPHPKRTGWACWGFTEGIFHSLRYALEDHDFDYLQLLSPTCLPIKPLGEFEAYVAASTDEANYDYIDLFDDQDAFMTVGYRAFTPEDSLRHRILRRLSSVYFGDGNDERSVAGVQLRTGFARDARGRMTLAARAALAATQLWSRRAIGRHVFDAQFRPCFGSIWFGARRSVVGRITERFQDPDLRRYFSRLRIADEFVIPTLLRSSGAPRGPSNHFVNTFVDANPAWFVEHDFGRLRDSGAFFARKFRDDTTDPVRRRVLDELVARHAREVVASRA